jgi:hypothetical protein
MSQRAIKKSKLQEFRRRKAAVKNELHQLTRVAANDGRREAQLAMRQRADHARDPNPFATVVFDKNEKILAIGFDRGRLADLAAKNNWTEFDMVDFPVVI